MRFHHQHSPASAVRQFLETRPGASILRCIRLSLAPILIVGRVGDRCSGIGIPPDALNNVFMRFSQLKPALKRARGGSGWAWRCSEAFAPLRHCRQVDQAREFDRLDHMVIEPRIVGASTVRFLRPSYFGRRFVDWGRSISDTVECVFEDQQGGAISDHQREKISATI